MSDTNLRTIAEDLLERQSWPAFSDRNADAIQAALQSVRDEALAEGRKSGMEEAAKVAESATMMADLNAGYKEEIPIPNRRDIAAAIRAKTEEVHGE